MAEPRLTLVGSVSDRQFPERASAVVPNPEPIKTLWTGPEGVPPRESRSSRVGLRKLPIETQSAPEIAGVARMAPGIGSFHIDTDLAKASYSSVDWQGFVLFICFPGIRDHWVHALSPS
jgi:hypothetical protein